MCYCQRPNSCTLRADTSRWQAGVLAHDTRRPRPSAVQIWRIGTVYGAIRCRGVTLDAKSQRATWMGHAATCMLCLELWLLYVPEPAISCQGQGCSRAPAFFAFFFLSTCSLRGPACAKAFVCDETYVHLFPPSDAVSITWEDFNVECRARTDGDGCYRNAKAQIGEPWRAAD